MRLTMYLSNFCICRVLHVQNKKINSMGACKPEKEKCSDVEISENEENMEESKKERTTEDNEETSL